MGYIAECLECGNTFKLNDLRKSPFNDFVSSVICPKCESGDFELTYTYKKRKLRKENHSINQFIGGSNDD